MFKQHRFLTTLCRIIAGIKTPAEIDQCNEQLREKPLFDLCQYHQIVAAIYYYRSSLKTYFPQLSPAFFKKAKRHTITSLSQSLVYEHFLNQFSKQLSDCSIPFRIFKGITLANRIYTPSYLRGFGDLDLLIKPKDLNKLQQLLFRKNFRLSEDLYTCFPIEVVKKYSFARHYVRDKPVELALDVHLNLSNKLHPFQFEYQDFWQNYQIITLNNQTYATFKDEHNAVYLLYHCWKHYYFKLSWFIDLFKFLDLIQIDSEYFEKLLKKYHLIPMWQLYLSTCMQLFGRFPHDIDTGLIRHYHTPRAHKIINAHQVLNGHLSYPFSIVRLVLPFYYLPQTRQWISYLIKQLLPPLDTVREFHEQQTLHPSWLSYIILRFKSLSNLLKRND